MIILGIDPGLAIVGFGVIEKIKNKKNGEETIKYLECGSIKTSPSMSKPDRLNQIQIQFSKIIKEYKPKILSIETLYFFKNAKTAISVSEVKGVLLSTAAKKKLSIYEFTPLQVKLEITGYGKSDKKEIQTKIEKLLRIKDKKIKSDDAIDALAIAICCSYKIKEDRRTDAEH